MNNLENLKKYFIYRLDLFLNNDYLFCCSGKKYIRTLSCGRG